MYRKLLAVILGMLLVFGVTGCSDNKETSDTENKLIEMSLQDDTEDSALEDGEELNSDEEDAADTADGDLTEDDAEEEDGGTGEEDTSQTESDPDIMSMDETAYVVSAVNYRDAPNTNSNVLGALQSGESVHCTGRYPNGWTRIEYNGQLCYVYGSFLSTGTGKEDSPSTAGSGNGNDDVEVVEAVPSQ